MVRHYRDAAYQVLREQLKQTRDAAGLTQQQIAERLSKPQSYVAKIEGGERRVDLVELLDLLEAIGADWREVIEVVDVARER